VKRVDTGLVVSSFEIVVYSRKDKLAVVLVTLTTTGRPLPEEKDQEEPV